MRVKMTGLHAVKMKLSGGKERTYYYAWRGGPRLEGRYGSPEFLASYNAAVASRKALPQGQFRSVIAAYKESAEFNKKLSPRTKADYLKHLAKIEEKFGAMPIVAFDEKFRTETRGNFKAWRDVLSKASVRQADYAWSILARVCSWGKDRGKLATNPAEKGGRLYVAERTDKIWTGEDEARFLLKAPGHMRLPLLLALWTGQRQGDLLRLVWSAYDGKALRFMQGKTKKNIMIPCGEVLRIALDAEKARERSGFVLLTLEGKPWTADGFRSSWRKACAKAKVEGVTFHDLRGSAVTRLALAGCSVPEIAAITGHSLKDVEAILDKHYLSRGNGLAESAMRKLEAAVSAGAKPEIPGEILLQTEAKPL